jgi:hypothetical protein
MKIEHEGNADSQSVFFSEEKNQQRPVENWCLLLEANGYTAFRRCQAVTDLNVKRKQAPL